MEFKKLIAVTSQLATLICAASVATLAAGEVDRSFQANLTNPSNGFGSKALPLPDGKTLISVRVPVLNGVAVGDLVRLNANGSVDTSFNSPEFYPQGPNAETVHALALQADGKILVGGIFSYVNSVERSALARLNSDGSLDTTFPNIFPNGVLVEDIYLYPDGRILAGGNFNPLSDSRRHITRVSANGVIDSTFDYNGGSANAFLVQPDGKIAVGEYWSNSPNPFALPRVRRFNENGSVDPTFAQINLNAGVADMEYLPDGKILLGGQFSTVQGASRVSVFRANSDGTVDATFQDPGLDTAVIAIALDAGGKFFIAGNYSQIGGVATSRKIHRLNADGSRDPSFVFFASVITSVTDVATQSDGKVIVLIHGGNPIYRATSTGAPDPDFVTPVPAAAAPAYSVLVQPDNKILVGGKFNFVNGVGGSCLARLNPDGTVDTGFAAAAVFCGSFGQLLSTALQPDGKILITGLSMGEARRLNTNGTLDISFGGTSGTNGFDIKYLPDGKVLIAGGTLKRFNSSGSLDTTLASVSGVQFSNIYKIAVQPDGKTIVVGHFTSVNGQARNYIARVNTDGTVDGSYVAQVNADVSTVVLQSDGKAIIGGSFTSVNSDSTKKYLARLNSDGTVDSTFSPVLDGPILGLKVQSDGRVLFGGAFASVGGVLNPRLGRVNQDGSRDTSFNVGAGPNSTVWGIDQQADGKIVYAGEFTRTNRISTVGVGRLLNTPPAKLFDYDGDGRSDVSVFRSSENKWYVLRSSDGTIFQPIFAAAGDIPVPADYDGDQKTDVAIFRPSNGQWWYLSSINGAQIANPFGENGDIPRPSDFDGDGKADLVRFRPSNSTWYRFGSTAGNVPSVAFGQAGDQPVIGDFDGDGKSDLAVFRPSNGDWWYAASSAGGEFRTVHWGQTGDLPVPADFDGDGKTDYAVFRPLEGGWYIYNSGGTFITTAFGLNGDRPIAADYDGDGRADIAVFRPSTGIWYLLRSTSGFTGLQFGIFTDTPTPNAFVP